MDAKTFEYMNERVKKFNEAQIKIKKLKDKIIDIEKFGLTTAYAFRNGGYIEIHYIDNSLMKETFIKLMSDKIEALEKEQSEI